jgi:ribonuclease HI
VAKKKKKYYVVWEGRTQGIFKDWETCSTQIKAYPNAKYKSFETLAEAEEAFANKPMNYITKKTKSNLQKSRGIPMGFIEESLSVDAACSGNPGIMEYQGVYTKNKEVLFRGGPFPEATNNVGEFLALVHGLVFLAHHNKLRTPIYSDSMTAIAWVKKKKANTTLKLNADNELLIEKIEKAENWLSTNSFSNPILKWDTESWGEIPADFGRK